MHTEKDTEQMDAVRLHILGAAGSGATTLGRALADHFGVPHFDTDYYYWMPTEPPFVQKRPLEERKKFLRDGLLQHERWVLSGSMMSWSDAADDLYTHIVFLSLPNDIRLQRLAARERMRYGDRILPGGDMAEQSQAFLDYAAQYESGRLDMRTRAVHERWLANRQCPVLRIESTESVPELVSAVSAWLTSCQSSTER